ncbi:MAG: helix-turn-helix domain-containing protein, partial [Chloroflexi bacterium]|nr:helix-turn-helix domain-containing protein [Chloroflexota bacterium]
SPQISGGKNIICPAYGLCLTRTGFAGTIVGVFLSRISAEWTNDTQFFWKITRKNAAKNSRGAACARIILAAGQGQTSSSIARDLKVSINTAQRWRNRFAKVHTISFDDLSLVDRLQDGPRPGAPSRITVTTVARLKH